MALDPRISLAIQAPTVDVSGLLTGVERNRQRADRNAQLQIQNQRQATIDEQNAAQQVKDNERNAEIDALNKQKSELTIQGLQQGIGAQDKQLARNEVIQEREDIQFNQNQLQEKFKTDLATAKRLNDNGDREGSRQIVAGLSDYTANADIPDEFRKPLLTEINLALLDATTGNHEGYTNKLNSANQLGNQNVTNKYKNIKTLADGTRIGFNTKTNKDEIIPTTEEASSIKNKLLNEKQEASTLKAKLSTEKTIRGQENLLRKEFINSSKDHEMLVDAIGKLNATKPTPAGDISLVISYMKVLDPASVVREGEFATAENTSGVTGKIRNIYNKLINGERLTNEQREQFKEQANSLLDSSQRNYNKRASRYNKIAEEQGLNPLNIVTSLRDEPTSIFQTEDFKSLSVEERLAAYQQNLNK